MLISTALLLDSNIRNSVCTPAKLPCRRVEVGYEILTRRKEILLLGSVRESIMTPSRTSFHKQNLALGLLRVWFAVSAMRSRSWSFVSTSTWYTKSFIWPQNKTQRDQIERSGRPSYWTITANPAIWIFAI
jgi:hypothetical protein